MSKWVSVVATLVLFFGFFGYAEATHDFMSDTYWHTEKPRITLFGDIHIAGNESVKINPNETASLVHTEGLRVQLSPFDNFSGFEAFNLHACVKMGTHWDKPDNLQTCVAGTYDLRGMFKGGERVRFELAYLWDANIGSNSDPGHGITRIPLGVSWHAFDGAKKAFDLTLTARHYLRSNEPLMRVAPDFDDFGSEFFLKNEAIARFRMPLFSWLGIWAEPSFGTNSTFSHSRFVTDVGLYVPLGKTVELHAGTRLVNHIGGGAFEPTETYFVGWKLRF